jgi:hypothetical protein
MTAASFVYYPTSTSALSGSLTSEWADTTIEGSRPAMRVEPLLNRIIVKVEGRMPSWLETAKRDINGLLRLGGNWDSYQARRINPESAAAAIRFLGLVMQENTLLPFIVPMSSGDIQLEWHSSGVDIEVEVTQDGPTNLSIEDQSQRLAVSSSVYGNPGLLKQVMLKLPHRK